jgi:CRP-like cAMP-binding protein
MPHSLSSRPIANRLLQSLSPEDFGLLEPHLETVDLPLRQRLELPNKRINHVYFIENGFASVVANGAGEKSIEVGLIGQEGMTGLAVVMATDRTPHETFMQFAGSGQRIGVADFNRAMEQSAGLRLSVLHYAHTFLVQATYTAAANGRGKIEERLARWLLMAQDRVGATEMTLTHEFLAMMLGVRRPGVTVALNMLESRGLIQVSRGRITIVDRDGLTENANGCYGAPEAEFERLFGTAPVIADSDPATSS